MSAVTLAVSSGCHVPAAAAAAAAFKSTLFGNATRLRCFKPLRELRREEKRKRRGFCCGKPLPDRSQHWRLWHLWERERCSKPRLLADGGWRRPGGIGGNSSLIILSSACCPGDARRRSRLHLRHRSLKGLGSVARMIHICHH